MIPSRTRVQILIKLSLNPGISAYFCALAKEFDVSPNAVRTELDNLRCNKVLVSVRGGRIFYCRANTDYPLFPEPSSMVRRITGIDELVRSVVDRLGSTESAYLVGDYARGGDSGIIDVVLVRERRPEATRRLRLQDGGVHRTEDPYAGPLPEGVLAAAGYEGIQTHPETLGGRLPWGKIREVTRE